MPYEYQTIMYNSDDETDGFAISRTLNTESQQGWEFCAVVKMENENDMGVILLRRQITGEQDAALHPNDDPSDIPF